MQNLTKSYTASSIAIVHVSLARTLTIQKTKPTFIFLWKREWRLNSLEYTVFQKDTVLPWNHPLRNQWFEQSVELLPMLRNESLTIFFKIDEISWLPRWNNIGTVFQSCSAPSLLKLIVLLLNKHHLCVSYVCDSNTNYRPIVQSQLETQNLSHGARKPITKHHICKSQSVTFIDHRSSWSQFNSPEVKLKQINR